MNEHEQSLTPDASMGTETAAALSRGGCILVLVTAFLGWMFAGVHLGISSLVMRVAVVELLGPVEEGQVAQWYGWLTCAFLFGAALGGLVLGRIGDRFGRGKAMALSILCYSIFSLLCSMAQTPNQLWILRFLTCLGIGGMWPNGIALVSEAWPNISRPFLAGAIGTAANVGILCFGIVTCFWYITADSWRWAFLLGGCPLVLGCFVLVAVPESPRWLALRSNSDGPDANSSKSDPAEARGWSLPEIFQRPLIRTTILGIALGTVPLFGGWGCSNWSNAWASQLGDRTPTVNVQSDDPTLKSRVVIWRALPGSISSLLGGALAMLIGRRLFYGLVSCAALFCAQYMFWMHIPTDPEFLYWTAALGLFSGFYFGWLPLCLPEMFPTRVRSMGAGVSFNFGRIITAFGILAGGALMVSVFGDNYARLGQITSLIYAFGVVVILFAPDTSKADLAE
jgi:MFS family permease